MKTLLGRGAVGVVIPEKVGQVEHKQKQVERGKALESQSD